MVKTIEMSKEEKDKVLAGGVTQGEIDKWKTKYGSVHQIECPRSDEPEDVATCYLKEPTRQTLHAAMKFAQSDPMKMNNILLNNCWLGGDPEIKTNDKLFMAAAAKLSDVYEVREATVKKL